MRIGDLVRHKNQEWSGKISNIYTDNEVTKISVGTFTDIASNWYRVYLLKLILDPSNDKYVTVMIDDQPFKA